MGRPTRTDKAEEEEDNQSDNGSPRSSSVTQRRRHRHQHGQTKERRIEQENKTKTAGATTADPAAGGASKSRGQIILWGLLFLHLYLVEGVVQGLSSVVPLLLQPLGFGYAAKGTFSVIWWSYLGRVIFAPIIDTIHPLKKILPTVPRHIAWIAGLELAAAGVLGLAVYTVAPMFMGTKSCEVSTLTYVFLGMNLMMALHKIAVDSWASSELQSVLPAGYASSIESMGFTIGHVCSYTVLAVFHSNPTAAKDEVNPSDDEIIGLRISMTNFMAFWAVVLLCSSFLVFSLTPRLKQGERDIGDDGTERGAFSGFSSFGSILTKKNIILLIFFLLTCRLPFIILKSGGDLAFVSRGIDLSLLAKMQLFMVPVELLVQWWTGYMSSRKNKSILYLWKVGFVVRIVLQLLYIPALMWISYISAAARTSNDPSNIRPMDCDDFIDYEMPTVIDCIGDVDEVPVGGARILSSVHHAFHAIGITHGDILGVLPLAILHIASQLALVLMTVPQRAFFKEIADPRLSGSYITLLNTAANLGAMWPAPLVLRAVDWWKHCDPNVYQICQWQQTHFPNMGSYEIVLILSCLYGFIWIAASSHPLTVLEKSPKSEWELADDRYTSKSKKE
eukprot:gb/GECG01006550.1/.p1 GENE.gb/GECG01006550.1/~~gb/GECG01006550.1/.p1  ORF type:complete len:618 (+),score=41.51 gb/GECG01006550.1/:1-1854(+)